MSPQEKQQDVEVTYQQHQDKIMSEQPNTTTAGTRNPSTPAPSAPSEPKSSEKSSQDNDDNEKPSFLSYYWQRIVSFYWSNEFLILIILAILLARAYPPLGATYLAPDITATWMAVIFIFVMAGLGLKTEELSKAFQQVKFNLFVQSFNFGVVSATIFGISRLFIEWSVIDRPLADGMVICASLPLTINMCCVLTKSAGGDEASAIFNAAFGNMVGVFLSPVLILAYLGVENDDYALSSVFYKLLLRVVLPVLVGQLLQKFSKTVVAFVKKYKPKFKSLQQYALVFIVYTVFCETFDSDAQSNVGDIFIMIAFQFVFLVTFMVTAWLSLGLLFKSQPELRVMGLFGCTHKTVAVGVPLINAIYEESPYLAQYTLPLLIWHPMQLILGSLLVPRLVAFVEREHERLGIVKDDDDEDNAKINDDNRKADAAQAVDEELAQETQERQPTRCDKVSVSASIMTGEMPAMETN